MKIAECSRAAIYLLLQFTIKYDHDLLLPRTHSNMMMIIIIIIIITVCMETFGEKFYPPEHSMNGTNEHHSCKP
jgi:hypothetical protein